MFFNTAGPCLPDRHYMVPPEPRLPEARELIEEGQYFIVHAPRQTGKTTTLASLARALTAEGEYLALRFSCEMAEVAGDDVGWAERLVLDELRIATENEDLDAELRPPDAWPEAQPGAQLRRARWSPGCTSRG